MKRKYIIIFLICALVASCTRQPISTPASNLPTVMAVESFLADITRNVAGDRLTIETLIPLGVDPHAYQPTPQDAARISDANILVLNGANLEAFLDPILQNTGNQNQVIIKAANGLTPRPDPSGENPEGDPHYWLDPNNVIHYVENIRDGLSKVDPAGAALYSANASGYITELKALDTWIKTQVQMVAPIRRQLVTNHDTFGYFADRYGFTVVGAIVPSISSGAAPSAQEMAALINSIRNTGTPAIFLESGTNVQLADQIASETGVKVVSGLYMHSLSAANGPAPTYIAMIKYDVSAIVEALK